MEDCASDPCKYCSVGLLESECLDFEGLLESEYINVPCGDYCLQTPSVANTLGICSAVCSNGNPYVNMDGEYNCTGNVEICTDSNLQWLCPPGKCGVNSCDP